MYSSAIWVRDAVGVYSVGKLIAEARKLASDYRRATGKPLAGVSVEIAEYDAARLLDLEICQPRVAGYDAIGHGKRQGQRILIKGRAIFDAAKKGHRIGQLNPEQEWDSVVLVLMDEDHETYEIYEAQRNVLIDELDKSKTSTRAKRGAMSVAKFKILGRLVWARDAGEIDIDAEEKQSSV